LQVSRKRADRYLANEEDIQVVRWLGFIGECSYFFG